MKFKMSRPPLHALQGFVRRRAQRQPVARGRVAAPDRERAEPPDPRPGGAPRPAPVRARRRAASSSPPTARRLFDRVAAAPRRDRTGAAAVPRAPRRRADAHADAVVRVELAGAAPAALPRRAPAARDQPAVDRRRGRLRARAPTSTPACATAPGNGRGCRRCTCSTTGSTPTAARRCSSASGGPRCETLGDFPLLGAPGGRWSDWFAQFGGAPPKRFVANFDDSETLHRAAVEGLGIALGRLTLMRPMVEAGRLVHALRRAPEGRVRALPGVSRALRTPRAACRRSANGCCRKPRTTRTRPNACWPAPRRRRGAPTASLPSRCDDRADRQRTTPAMVVFAALAVGCAHFPAWSSA